MLEINLHGYARIVLVRIEWMRATMHDDQRIHFKAKNYMVLRLAAHGSPVLLWPLLERLLSGPGPGCPWVPVAFMASALSLIHI